MDAKPYFYGVVRVMLQSDYESVPFNDRRALVEYANLRRDQGYTVTVWTFEVNEFGQRHMEDRLWR